MQTEVGKCRKALFTDFAGCRPLTIVNSLNVNLEADLARESSFAQRTGVRFAGAIVFQGGYGEDPFGDRFCRRQAVVGRRTGWSGCAGGIRVIISVVMFRIDVVVERTNGREGLPAETA